MTTTGSCPICHGSGKVPVPADYIQCIPSKPKTESECQNCGGQYMFGRGSGRVLLNRDGAPCTHEYVAHIAGRCLTSYQCRHCVDHYQIDSGD